MRRFTPAPRCKIKMFPPRAYDRMVQSPGQRIGAVVYCAVRAPVARRALPYSRAYERLYYNFPAHIQRYIPKGVLYDTI